MCAHFCYEKVHCEIWEWYIVGFVQHLITYRSQLRTDNNTNYIRPQALDTLYACTVYPKKYAHGFVVLCFVVVIQSFIMNSHEVFIHIHQGCFAGTGAIVRLPQCQWSKPDGYGEISQCITTTKHSKAKTVCIFLGIYCTSGLIYRVKTPYHQISLLPRCLSNFRAVRMLKFPILWLRDFACSGGLSD